MPMHRNMPDFVEMNQQRSDFLKNPIASMDTEAGSAFVAKADPAKLNSIPNVGKIINTQIAYDQAARKKKKKPINIFDDEEPPSQLRKKLIKQTASSLHPGNHQNVGLKVKEMELKDSR